LLVIGVIATVVIGSAATLIALQTRSSADDDGDKPAPTIAVPKPAAVPSDPSGHARPTRPARQRPGARNPPPPYPPSH
jgi:hypothetical protein